jgi:signal peptidase I
MKKVILAIVTMATMIIASAQTAPYPATFFRIPTDVMAPDIPQGAVIVIAPVTGAIVRGDVISYAETGSSLQFIKRVIAVPGDRIENTLQGLKVNGKLQPGFERTETSGPLMYSGGGQFPPFGQALTVGPDCVYVLSNSAHDMVDSRHRGTIRLDQVQGRAYLWRDVMKVDGWPKVFLSRMISNIKSLLPRKIEEDFILEDLSIKGDRTMHSAIRFKGTLGSDKRDAIFEQFVQSRKMAYCNGSFDPKLFGVSVSYAVMSDTGQSIAEFGFNPENCQ